MGRRYRLILLFLEGVLLIIIGLSIERTISDLLQSFWFSSGLLLLILLSLIDQPFFSNDSNIFLNAVTASISLLLVPENSRHKVFYIISIYMVYLLSTSYILMWIRKNPLKNEKKSVQFFSRFNRNIGRPKIIFSTFFLWGAIDQYTMNSESFSKLFLFWTAFILLDTLEFAKIIDKLFQKKGQKDTENIGVIFGVQSQNTFLAKLNSEYKNIKLFGFVEFKSSVDDKVRKGLICDMMLLNQEQWIKIITNEEIEKIYSNQQTIANYIPNYVYEVEASPQADFINRFVGIITEGSLINKVKFVYNSKAEVSEGDLLEIMISGERVLYQIVEGVTQIEQLTNKNQSGFIIGHAVPLGTWNKEEFKFDKFGWVPEINSPILLASDIEKSEANDDEIQLGCLPGTNYPVIINKEFAITHHMAIIGVTGTGKSVFSRHLIRRYLEDDNIKVICVDFTGEYGDKFKDLDPKVVIDDEHTQTILDNINWIELEEGEFLNRRDHKGIKNKKRIIIDLITDSLTTFLQSSKNLSILELPEVENTSGVMAYTKYFFRALFKLAKTNSCYNKRICLVLEEAHTIIPEWNSTGISEKTSQPLINSIAQIALQGRKYNIGLLVIAQRTANVSKTILTQCNSIISFQGFDKTSTDFLANYFGSDIAETLSTLKFRQAVAAGKAFKSNVPMIFKIPRINEEDFIEEATLSPVAITREEG